VEHGVKIITIVLLLLLSQSIFAQEKGPVINKFRGQKLSEELFTGENAVLNSKGLTWLTTDGDVHFLQIDSIISLERFKESNTAKYIGEGMFVGAIVAGAVYAIAILEHQNSGRYKRFDNEKMAKISIALLLGGGLTGLMTAANKSEWVDVPIETTLSYDPSSKQAQLVIGFNF